MEKKGSEESYDLLVIKTYSSLVDVAQLLELHPMHQEVAHSIPGHFRIKWALANW